MTSVENELNKMDTFLEHMTAYTMELKHRSDMSKLDNLASMRGFPRETLEKLDIFYICDATEMLIPYYLAEIDDFGVVSNTNKKPIFHNRFVMPIKDSVGRVQNLVGYNADADERYVYGTSKYYRRRDTLYGMENLSKAYEDGYAILTEGITDTIRLRSLGYENSFAYCGTHGSSSIMRQLNRCRYGVIRIPDRDSAGQRALKKQTCNRSITLNVYIKYKDVDEMCHESEENTEILKEYLDACIDWIKLAEHRGFKTSDEVVTIT